MKRLLQDLLKNVPVKAIKGREEVEIWKIEFDSRKIQTLPLPVEGNVLYVAQRGTQVDGHDFIDQAIQNGATVIVCETFPKTLHENITYVQVPHSAAALGQMASAFYHHPSTQLNVIGITGTNGKTTTVTLLYQLFSSMGYPVGLLSTIGNKILDKNFPATHTTPDTLQLNQMLREMVDAGCEYCFMEVSSHALSQYRVEGIQFYGAVFSNITHDHLDFHHTFANYIQAKQSLFDKLLPNAFALINIDDKNGEVMVQHSHAKILTYSLMSGANFKGKIFENHFEGLSMSINGKEVYFKLCGKFNAYNLLAVYATAAILLEGAEEEILAKMSNLESASGRFQLIRNDKGNVAIVDYAHTPDALQNVLSTIKDIVENNHQIITIVGCGGDRDKLKRPVMAKTACEYSDMVVFTSDNPRTENPADILADMEKGIPQNFKRNVLIIENRKEAIKTACLMLSEDAVLLVAGKGHETYQEINHVKYHFDDTEVVREFL